MCGWVGGFEGGRVGGWLGWVCVQVGGELVGIGGAVHDSARHARALVKVQCITSKRRFPG